MNESITYKCPGCGAAMTFDPDTQKLTCPYCFTSYDINEYIREYGEGTATEIGTGTDAGRTDDTSADTSQDREDAPDREMKVYHCTSCGAELVSDEYTSATICGFCGNPTLVSDRLRGKFTPSLIIPFKLDKEAATQRFVRWAKKGLLTPGDFHSAATIEKLSGIYVPFWFYDVRSSNQMNGTGLVVRREDHANYYYTITDYYNVYRNIEATFIRIPADASAKMPDGDMDKLEPFDYSALCSFEMPYLSGYLSERYNYTAEDMRNRIFARTNQYIKDATSETLRQYSSVTGRTDSPQSGIIGDAYALLPVWMLNYHYKNADYTFYMNGQTGKIVATRPLSNVRTAAAFILSFAAALIIAMIGGLILW